MKGQQPAFREHSLPTNTHNTVISLQHLKHIMYKQLISYALNLTAAKTKFQLFVNSFSLIQINMRSLSKNFSFLETFISEMNFPFAIIAVTELWMNSNHPDFEMVNIQSYKFEPCPRQNR